MSKKDSPRLRRRYTINGKPAVTVKPARKTRSRTRKPKYLSLRLQLSPEQTQQSRKMTHASAGSATNNHRHQQLNLFPLHPVKSVEEKDTHDVNMAYFFDSADGGATTLTTLFGARSSSLSSEEDNNSLSPSLTYAYGEQCGEDGALVRTAMRNKERDASEERWVCYSEVVERKDEEVTSCAGAGDYLKSKSQSQRLSLKLDYEEILNAWSDKGPLYIQLESPQTVPDLSRDFFFHESSKGVQDGWGSSNGGLWTVPENSNFSSSGKAKVKEEAVQLGGGEEWKVGQREASVLRYKEKRQNRLFSKRIRYEVRKINAEKRPRMKGRFVKRN